MPFFLLAASIPAQASDPHGNLSIELEPIPDSDQLKVQLDWPASDGHYYFIEQTARLEDPFASIKLFAGARADTAGNLGTDLQATAPRGFYRLYITDDESDPRLLADDDGDKISNLLEAQAGWDAYEQPADLTLDTDNDGMPDYWENFHFGNLNQDGVGDFDGDGVSNGDEFSFGDNPEAEETDRTVFSFQVTSSRNSVYSETDAGEHFYSVTTNESSSSLISNKYCWNTKEAHYFGSVHWTSSTEPVSHSAYYEGSGFAWDSFSSLYEYYFQDGIPDGDGGFLDEDFKITDRTESWGSYRLTNFSGAPITLLAAHHERALEIIRNDYYESHSTIETGVVSYEVIHWDGESLTIDGNAVSLPTNERSCKYPYGSVRLPFLVDLDIVTINSFIRQNNIDHPFNILPGPDHVFHGDNRGFNEHGTYRTQQKFSVVTQQAADANGLLDNAYTDDSDGNGEYRNATGITGEYDKTSSLDSSGNLTQAARDDTVLNDGHLKVDVGQASIAGMSIVPNRLADGKVEIFCKGSAADPLIDDAPTLDYEFTIVIDRTNPSAPVYSISGPLDGFPDYEVYINGQRVFGWDAASQGQTAASLPWPMEKDVTDAKPNNLNQPLP